MNVYVCTCVSVNMYEYTLVHVCLSACEYMLVHVYKCECTSVFECFIRYVNVSMSICVYRGVCVCE